MKSVKNITEETLSPVFIHSLFRAGSTYLFNQFRRSSAGYWCYQEPLHELPYYFRHTKERILDIDNSNTVALRHPELDAPYFQEIYEVADICLPKLEDSYIYKSYFSDTPCESGIYYFKALIDAAKGRPVIQECRTSARISTIKKSLGGIHIYLWRNPWDQWWSLNINDYFPAVLQLIISAPNSPEAITRLRSEVPISDSPTSDISDQIKWFQARPLSSEQSYLAFYLLWCLSLVEGIRHADLLLSIDELSNNPTYAAAVDGSLQKLGISGVSFENCKTPQTSYTTDDQDFFRKIEDRAHGLLLLSGTPQPTLDEIIELRRKIQLNAGADRNEESLIASNLLRDAGRARALTRNATDSLAKASVQHRQELAEQEQRWKEQADLIERDTKAAQNEAHQRISELGQQLTDLQHQLSSSQQHLRELEEKAHIWWARSNELDKVYSSHSWRLTQPLRRLRATTKSLMSAEQAPRLLHKPLRVFVTQALKLYTKVPFVRKQVKRVLNWAPGLRNRIRSYATNQGIVAGPFTPSMPANALQLSTLSPRGQKIFHEIMSAMAQQNIGKELK